MRVVCAATGGLLGLVLLLGAAVAGVVSAITATGATTTIDCANPGSWPTVAGLTAEQTCNAGIIVHVGQTMSIPTRGLVIGVAAALQESSLRNLRAGPDDSIGLFQQRPSQRWGTPQQLHDPHYATRAFYQHLLRVPGWRDMPLAQAAQTVQRSENGSRYTTHEHRATRIVNACLQGRCAPAPGTWVRPAPGRIISGFRPPERPSHHGIDIGTPRGSTIRAASAGVVITVTCDSSSGTCDQDGGPNVAGCGWHLDLKHAHNMITRYCHMLRRPAVQEGQRVAAGQPIGLVGSSGNSSGPHLHLEVHLNGDTTSAGATDPAIFLKARGVRL